MTDIDDLLRQAKPLYIKRKRVRRLAAGAFSAFVFAFAFVFSFHLPQKVQSPIYDVYSSEVYQAQYGSVIEELGLPTDDFGLLSV